MKRRIQVGQLRAEKGGQFGADSPATTGPLNAGISIGQIDLHKQAATTSRQIIAKISKRITANFW